MAQAMALCERGLDPEIAARLYTLITVVTPAKPTG
jgi:hypothetical protein